MQTARSLTVPEGAVARLVSSYVNRRGIPKAKLAERSGTHAKVIAAIMRGSYDNGTEALGLRFRPEDGERVIFAVARALEIPERELDAAILADLKRAVSPTSSPCIISHELPAGVVSIDVAREARGRAEIIRLPVRTAG